MGVTSIHSTTTNNKLVVVWSSADPEVAMSMTFMYTHAAKRNKWFEEVTLVVWGPSAKLITEDQTLQQKVRDMQHDGVEVEACLVCANMYGVAGKLEQMGFNVRHMGKPLSDYLKSGVHILNF